jgi:UDP-GlcNAc3NAcA epimerase
MHPRTGAVLQDMGLLQRVADALVVLPPLGYLDMLQLEKFAALIVTDSGGVQKEAFFCGVPCVTLRPETEWTELVVSGWNRLVSPDDSAQIVRTIDAAIGTRGLDVQPYGDGQAARQIAAALRASAGDAG